MLLDWPLGFAGVAGLVLELALEVGECTMAGSCRPLRLLAVVVEVRQRRGLLAVMGRRRALANLCCCCLHRR